MEKDLETNIQEVKEETNLLLEAEKKALDAAILFNRIVHGKPIQEYTDSELIEAINLQNNITIEEVLETIENADIDLVEELDGYADVFYTYPYLEHLIAEFNSREITQAAAKDLKLRRLQTTRHLAHMLLETLTFKPEIVLEAVNRVVDNNLAKFTTEPTEFNTWTYDDKFKPTQQDIDGITYYYLTDKNGKVRKKHNFDRVVLKDLVGV